MVYNDLIIDLRSISEERTYKNMKQALTNLINELDSFEDDKMPRILRDENYRCRICERKSHKEYNSYIVKLSKNIHIRICRHCWLRIVRYNSLLRKVKNKDMD